MPRVAASEYDLLTVARAVVGHGSPETVEPLLRRARDLPAKVGPTAMALLERTLARGTVMALARYGGWRPDTTLIEGKPRTGRAWERHQAPQIPFSAFSMALLRWLVSQPLGGTGTKPLRAPSTLALGDEILLYLSADLLVRTGLEAVIGNQGAFRASPLCWLGFADHLSRYQDPPELGPATFAPYVVGDGAIVLECLSADLARRQAAVERTKEHIGSCERMIRLGAAQEQALSGLLDAASRVDRRDLGRFLIDAARDVLVHRPPASWWVGSLESRAPLRERTAALRAAGALLRVVGRLAHQAEENRGVRFFDDDYDRAQLLLTQWERLGDGSHHAAEILRALSSVDAALETPA